MNTDKILEIASKFQKLAQSKKYWGDSGSQAWVNNTISGINRRVGSDIIATQWKADGQLKIYPGQALLKEVPGRGTTEVPRGENYENIKRSYKQSLGFLEKTISNYIVSNKLVTKEPFNLRDYLSVFRIP